MQHSGKQLQMPSITRCWNNAFKEFMLSLGLVQSVANPCVISFVSSKISWRLSLFHVDDLIRLTETAEEDDRSQDQPGKPLQDEGCGYTPPLSRS